MTTVTVIRQTENFALVEIDKYALTIDDLEMLRSNGMRLVGPISQPYYSGMKASIQILVEKTTVEKV